MVTLFSLKSPDEWATTKQACRDTYVVTCFLPSTIRIYIYIHCNFFNFWQAIQIWPAINLYFLPATYCHFCYCRWNQIMVWFSVAIHLFVGWWDNEEVLHRFYVIRCKICLTEVFLDCFHISSKCSHRYWKLILYTSMFWTLGLSLKCWVELNKKTTNCCMLLNFIKKLTVKRPSGANFLLGTIDLRKEMVGKQAW